MSLTTLDRARRYLAKCPPAISGQGGHNATFHAAAVLVHDFALDEADALTMLREWNRACQPPWSEAELRHKVNSAAHAAHTKPRGHLLGEDHAGGRGRNRRQGRPAAVPPAPPKPVFRPMVLQRIAAKVSEVLDVVGFIQARSAVPVAVQDCASFVRWLYPHTSGEKVLVFSTMKSKGQMLWEANRGDVLRNADFPTGPDGVWFLPQPVDGAFHPNPRLGGKRSRRSEESVTAWRFVVLESDAAAPEDWLRCLIQMPLRIVSICESGGRSIHALVRIDAASKADWDAKVGGPGVPPAAARARRRRFPQFA